MKGGKVLRKIRNTGSMLRRGAIKGRTLAGKVNRAAGGLPGKILEKAITNAALAALV